MTEERSNTNKRLNSIFWKLMGAVFIGFLAYGLYLVFYAQKALSEF